MVGEELDSESPLAAHPDGRINSTLDDLLGWAAITLGKTVTAADHTWRHDRSLVLELVDADGEHWFLKHPRDTERFEREATAYRTTLHMFGDRVPRVIGMSETYRCILLAAAPGRLARGTAHGRDPDVHRQAGMVLAWLHRSDWPEPSPEHGGHLARQRASVLEKSKRLLDGPDYRFVRRATAVLTKPAEPLTVPCHRDFWPRNWVVDSSGFVRVIDFGKCERDLAVRDFLLLTTGREWQAHPELRTAFFEGYGRTLDAHEEAQLAGLVTLAAANRLIRTTQKGNKPLIAKARQAFDRIRPTDSTDKLKV